MTVPGVATKHRQAMVSISAATGRSCLLIFLVVLLRCTNALKHNYYTGRHGDDRTFIGPLGFPFGFLDTGHYNLTVFDFELASPKKPHKHDPHKRHTHRHDRLTAAATTTTTEQQTALTDALKGVGFLLKRFDNEADFTHYMNWVSADDSRCIFQPFLDRDDNEPFMDDDYQPQYFEDDDYVPYYGRDDYGDGYEYEDDFFSSGSSTGPEGDESTGYSRLDDDFVLDGSGNDDVGDDLFPAWNPPPRDDDTTRHQRGRKRQRQRRRRQQTRKQQQQRHRKFGASVGYELNEGVGEVTDFVSEDGIFLDMMPKSRWKPRTPFVAYNFEPGEAGLYFLMYQVCFRDDINKNSNQLLDVHSRFELDFHFSNLDMFGKKSYLPAGEMPLPWIFFIFSVVYCVLLYFWISNIVLIKEGKPGHFNKDDEAVMPPSPVGRGAQLPTATVYPIHYMMGFLLALKFLSLLFEAIRYHYLRVTGTAMFWSAVYYTFAFLKGISLFTVILLIGTGWSFVKPFLADREKKMILAVLMLQVVNNIAIVVLTQETEGEKSFDRWTALLHLVDIFCCCAVLIPIVWQVNQLEKNMEQDQHDEGADDDEENKGLVDVDEFDDEIITEDELDGGGGQSAARRPTRRPADARLASKLKLFRSFYLIVIAYIYITRIFVYLFAATLNYKHTWVRYFTVEVVTLIFYVTVGTLFRPMNENPYLHLRRTNTRGSNGTVKVEMKKIDPKTKSVID